MGAGRPIGQPRFSLTQQQLPRFGKRQLVAAALAGAREREPVEHCLHLRLGPARQRRRVDHQACQATASISICHSERARACTTIRVDAGRAAPRYLLRTGL